VAPLFQLTRKNLGYKSMPLPEAALQAFYALQKQLTSEPVMAFPKADQQYALVTDAATRTADTPGGLRAILTQVDKYGQFYAILFASRQLKDHMKNHSPFLLEAPAAVWGMDFFNEYLRGKQFILYTDHKPLEKLSHLHSKTMNQLQTALLEHNFIIQNKNGSNMPADYLSRLPGTKEDISSISAFDLFQSDLFDLQMKNEHLQMLQNFMTKNEWPSQLSLIDYNYPQTALYLPAKYCKRPCTRPMTASLGDTMPLKKPT
jgi:RNase H-like domain found in reverse transcriptase